jgi:hypothetical protein
VILAIVLKSVNPSPIVAILYQRVEDGEDSWSVTLEIFTTSVALFAPVSFEGIPRAV